MRHAFFGRIARSKAFKSQSRDEAVRSGGRFWLVRFGLRSSASLHNSTFTAHRKAASQGATPMPEKNLRELFHETLKDIYFAEKKILTALPKMAKAAQAGELRAAFQKHQAETEGQVER